MYKGCGHTLRALFLLFWDRILFSFFMVLTSSTASLILSPGLVSNADFAHARFSIKLRGSHIFFLFPVALFHLGGKWWVVTMPQPETD